MGSSANAPPSKTDHSSAFTPTRSRSDFSSPVSKQSSTPTANSEANVKEGKRKWLSSLKEWITVTEPSIQALKQHRAETFKKAGIALDEPQAHARLHAPIGTIPDGAIKPAGRGPDPEQVAKKRGQERKKVADEYGRLWTGGSISQTSSNRSVSASGSSFTFANSSAEK